MVKKLQVFRLGKIEVSWSSLKTPNFLSKFLGVNLGLGSSKGVTFTRIYTLNKFEYIRYLRVNSVLLSYSTRPECRS